MDSRSKSIVAAGFSALLLAACSSGSAPGSQSSSPAAQPSSPSQSSPTASTPPPATPTPSAPTSAGELTKALEAQGLPIKAVIVYNESTDPNNQLGRPGKYTSKTAFVDKRVDHSKVIDNTKGSVDLGGGVEFFTSEALARARAEYIQKAMAQFPMLGSEYDYVSGPALLRLSGILTPTEAKTYKQPLSEIMGAPANLVGG